MAGKDRSKTGHRANYEGLPRRVDLPSIVGIAVAGGAIVAGNYLEGGAISTLVQTTAFVIVIGGTLGAVLIQTPWRDFRSAVGFLSWVFWPPLFQREALIDKTMKWSEDVRRGGLLALEKRVDDEPHVFVRKGMALLVDGCDGDKIRTALEVEIDTSITRMAKAARVYEAMGGYSPTLGIMGAVLGLIQVMRNLSDPTQLGVGIAVAFVATIYGVGFANLFYLPVSNKLKTLSRDQMDYQEMVIDALVMIADGENPTMLRSKLEGYLD